MQRFQQHRHALGSEVFLTIIVEDEAKAAGIFEILWRKITAFEQRFSRFLPTSELTSFNTHAGETQAISAEFRDLLLATKHFAEVTNGLYNPFILPELQRAGYKGSWPMPDNTNASTNFEDRALTSWQELIIEDSSAEIPTNAALDFGGIGKGYLLDELGQWLHENDIRNFWLSLGGDILCSGFDLDEPWRIAVQHALHEDEIVAHATNKSGDLFAVATSGVTKRKGEAWHHIIDPRTGEPAKTRVLTATICAPEATEADVFAKCVVIDETTAATQANALVQSSANDDVIIKQRGTVWN